MIPVTQHQLPQAFLLDLLQITFTAVSGGGSMGVQVCAAISPFQLTQAVLSVTSVQLSHPNAQQPKLQSPLSLFSTYAWGRLLYSGFNQDHFM